MEISLPVNLSEFVDEYFTIYLKEKKINMIFIYLMKINSALRAAIHLYKERFIDRHCMCPSLSVCMQL